jgi:hypothetical protein
VEGMNAHKVEAILSENGTLTLRGLPFQVGDAVEVIILEKSLNQEGKTTVVEQPEPNLYPLRGKVLYYEEPFEPAIPAEE